MTPLPRHGSVITEVLAMSSSGDNTLSGFYLFAALPLKRTQSQKRYSPAFFTIKTALADRLFILGNRAILSVTVYRNLSQTWTKLPQSHPTASYFGQVP